MACPLSAEQINNLRMFIGLCKQDPSILHVNELGFFKSYIESLGGVIPVKKLKEEEKDEEPKISNAEPEVEEVESAESDIELDYDGVIEPDNDPPEVMGSSEKEVSEEEMEQSNEKKKEAIRFYNDGKYQDAIKTYTEAILLNPRAAVLYAKRGQCFLQMQKPNACIRDCSQALEINPDNAAAYKFRGRAHRLLGNFQKAAEDLRMACKIDFDEQADEWLKEVTPNARKIEEHQRKYERKKLEKELKEARERIQKMKEEQKKAEAETKGDGEGEGAAGIGDVEDILELLKDPELMAAFRDPEVMEAFAEVSQSPENIFKYQNNPNMNKILQKLSARLKNKNPAAFSQMAAGLRGFAEGAAKRTSENIPPKSASDVDLD